MRGDLKLLLNVSDVSLGDGFIVDSFSINLVFFFFKAAFDVFR